MNEREIKTLYAKLMAYDHRKWSESNVAAWHQQAVLNRWTLTEAIDAVDEHHSQSDKYLMPAHITAIIKARRQHPAPVAEHRQLNPPPPAHPEHITQTMTEIRRQLGWHTREDIPTDALIVECPWCHAAPQRPCTQRVPFGPRSGQFQPLQSFHPSRVELAGNLVQR